MTITTRLECRAFEPFAKILQAILRLLLFLNTSTKKDITTSLKAFFLLKSSINNNNTLTITTYYSDLFEGDINPGTTNGQKLYTLTISN